MADVIDFTARKAAHQPDTGYAACACGSGWFELRYPSTSRPAAVCLGDDGTVTGYSGAPFCVECGTVWTGR